MATNLQAMQVTETMGAGGKGKVRNYPTDTNLRAMTMGSWHANLSKGGVPNNKLGRNHTAGGAVTAPVKGKR